MGCRDRFVTNELYRVVLEGVGGDPTRVEGREARSMASADSSSGSWEREAEGSGGPRHTRRRGAGIEAEAARPRRPPTDGEGARRRPSAGQHDRRRNEQGRRGAGAANPDKRHAAEIQRSEGERQHRHRRRDASPARADGPRDREVHPASPPADPGSREGFEAFAGGDQGDGQGAAERGAGRAGGTHPGHIRRLARRPGADPPIASGGQDLRRMDIDSPFRDHSTPRGRDVAATRGGGRETRSAVNVDGRGGLCRGTQTDHAPAGDPEETHGGQGGARNDERLGRGTIEEEKEQEDWAWRRRGRALWSLHAEPVERYAAGALRETWDRRRACGGISTTDIPGARRYHGLYARTLAASGVDPAAFGRWRRPACSSCDRSYAPATGGGVGDSTRDSGPVIGRSVLPRRGRPGRDGAEARRFRAPVDPRPDGLEAGRIFDSLNRRAQLVGGQPPTLLLRKAAWMERPGDPPYRSVAGRGSRTRHAFPSRTEPPEMPLQRVSPTVTPPPGCSMCLQGSGADDCALRGPDR